MALAGQDEIGAEWKRKIDEAGFQEIDRTASINGPGRAIILERLNRSHASMIEDRIIAMGDKSSIEVSAEQADLGGHERANLGSAFANAIRLRLALLDSHAKLDTIR